MIEMVVCANCTRGFMVDGPGEHACPECESTLKVERTVRSGLESTVMKRGKDVEPQYVALAGPPGSDGVVAPSATLPGAQPTLTLRGWCADIVRAIRWRMR